MPILTRLRSLRQTLVHRDRLDRERNEERRARFETLTRREFERGADVQSARGRRLPQAASRRGQGKERQSVINPLSESAASDAIDLDDARRAQAGNREALESIIRRHQPWIYNLVLRMVYRPQYAEDITQEILIKLLTKLATFEGRSRFSTWLYRIVVNHVLNVKRQGGEWTFDRYRKSLESAQDLDLPDPNAVPADVQLLVEEARIGCTSGMLLCLDQEQRLIYILGEIFGVGDTVGAELLEISRDNFRQKLSRTRRDLHSFMQGQCGLVNKSNPCRCARKTRAFIEAGYVNPQNLLFARERVTRVREVADKRLQELNALDEAYGEIHRDHPFHESPDFVPALKALLDGPSLKAILEKS